MTNTVSFYQMRKYGINIHVNISHASSGILDKYLINLTAVHCTGFIQFNIYHLQMRYNRPVFFWLHYCMFTHIDVDLFVAVFLHQMFGCVVELLILGL